MTRETIEHLARELATTVNLPAEDWPAIVEQAERIRASVQTLAELPLDGIEPAAVYRCQSLAQMP
jgi:Protein of unknown function (DUF4089)